MMQTAGFFAMNIPPGFPISEPFFQVECLFFSASSLGLCLEASHMCPLWMFTISCPDAGK